MAIVVLGASGYTGRLVVERLLRRGAEVVAAGRDADRVRTALGAEAGDVELAVVDVTDPAALAAVARRAEVLVSTVGPFVDLGRPALDAALAAGCHYVDSTGEQPFIRWAFEQDDRARQAGIVAVPACGYDYVPGDLLASLAADAVAPAQEVHVAYAVKGATTMVTGASRGTRTSIAGLLGEPSLAWVRRELRPERPASVRRLAWFPKPVGPAHAAGFPGGEPLMVPRHHPSVHTVRTYLAMPTMLAELVQMLATAARWAPVRRTVQKVLAAGSEGPSEERRTDVRWACVAEAEGEGSALARAWVSATDIYGMTAEFLATAALALQRGEGRGTGVLSPAQAFDATTWLDHLADTTDLRWSIRRP